VRNTIIAVVGLPTARGMQWLRATRTAQSAADRKPTGSGGVPCRVRRHLLHRPYMIAACRIVNLCRIDVQIGGRARDQL
jgi:hypothetical protein